MTYRRFSNSPRKPRNKKAKGSHPLASYTARKLNAGWQFMGLMLIIAIIIGTTYMLYQWWQFMMSGPI